LRFWQTNDVIPSKVFYSLGLIWFFGWGFLLLKFPRQSHRFLAWGRDPKPWNLKLARIVGYMCLAFGALLLVELAFGFLH
jgi:hypothetical protein